MTFVREPLVSQGFGCGQAILLSKHHKTFDEVFGSTTNFDPNIVIVVVDDAGVTPGCKAHDDSERIIFVAWVIAVSEYDVARQYSSCN